MLFLTIATTKFCLTHRPYTLKAHIVTICHTIILFTLSTKHYWNPLGKIFHWNSAGQADTLGNNRTAKFRKCRKSGEQQDYISVCSRASSRVFTIPDLQYLHQPVVWEKEGSWQVARETLGFCTGPQCTILKWTRLNFDHNITRIWCCIAETDI